MAIFKANIISYFDQVNKVIVVKDTTGFYNAIDNPNGWGAPNIERAAITSARVELYKGDGRKSPQLIQSVNVTTIVRNSVDPEIVLDLGDEFIKTFSDINKDGIYKIIYLINDTEYTSLPILQFVYEDVQLAASKHWATLACNYDIYKKKELEQECIWLEGYLAGIRAVERRATEAQFYNMLRFMEQRIKINIKNELVNF